MTLKALGPILLALRLDPPNGMTDERRGVGQFQFLLDVAAMHIDGLWAQRKLLGNFPGAFALANELENLELPVAELLDR